MNHTQASAPVALSDRILSIDVLRGFALLGILVINIEFFGLASAIYFDPSLSGGFEGINLLTWRFSSLFFLQKMMAIFSMLFGAGLVLMFDRFERRGAPFAGVYYRRLLWLLLIGLFHGYLLWHGDILFTYAVCGLILYFFRRRTTRTLLIWGGALLLVGMVMQFGSGMQFDMLRTAAAEVEAARAAGETVEPQKERLAEAWENVSAAFVRTDAELAEETAAFRGGYLSNLKQRFPETVMMQTQALPFMMIWRVMGLMLLGMGLLKAGVWAATRSVRFYVWLIVVGYAVGLPLTFGADQSMIIHNFELVHRFQVGNQLNWIASVLVALAHASVVLLICKQGVLATVRRLLAAVGRTALSNYLIQTLVCTTLFYGYGLGLFGRIDRFGLLGVVVAIWIVQLALSSWWLKRFQFGPAEWLWRSLTYWRRQPLRAAQ